MLSYRKVAEFILWVAELLEEGKDPEWVALQCRAYEFKLSFTADMERAGASISREWQGPRK